MGTHLEPGTFNFITPAQYEPITTHRKKKSQPRRGDGLHKQIVSPAKPPTSDNRPILNVPAELLVEIIGYGTQRDKLAWMLACKKFVNPAERAIWRVCGRKGFFKLLSMDEEKRERFVKMINHLHIGDDPSCTRPGILRIRAQVLQDGIYPDHIPVLPASHVIHAGLKSLTALADRFGIGGNGAVDHVFAALKQAPGLEVLRITQHIERNTPDAFPQLLECLPRLRVFEAHYMRSGALLPHLAKSSTIQDIGLHGTINSRLVHQTLQVSGAFNNLEALDITLLLDAAKNLLPHLYRLKKLWIVLKRTPTLSYEERKDATVASLQAIGAMSNLTMLQITFVYLDLAKKLEPLKQLSSLRTLYFMMLEPDDIGGPVLDRHLTDFMDILPHLPLEEFDSALSFRSADLDKLCRACPDLRTLKFCRWYDFAKPDGGLLPVFPKLDYLQAAIRPLDRSGNSNKYIKTLANKIAVAAPILTHFQYLGMFIRFEKRGGIRRWFARFRDYEEDKWVSLQDFDSHKDLTRKNRKRS